MAVIKMEEVPDLGRWGVWKIEERESELIPLLVFSDWEKEHVNRLHHVERRIQWLASRVLLKRLLGTSEFVSLTADEFGKPKITNYPFHLSISHCHGYAAAIISPDYHVGIDIERHRDDITKIQHKFLTGPEFEFLDRERRLEHLLVAWSAKEVMYKLYSRRKLDFRKHMRLDAFSMRDRGQITGFLQKDDYSSIFHMNYVAENNYVLVFGTDPDDPREPLKE